MSNDNNEIAKRINELDEEAAVYVISVAAELSGLHPQTLRQYDRLGLVSPDRTTGRNRRYSLRDIALLRNVTKLVDEGINHVGIKRIIELESAMANLSLEVAKLRIEVDALLKENPPKSLVLRRDTNVIVYKQDKDKHQYAFSDVVKILVGKKTFCDEWKVNFLHFSKG